MLNRMGYLAYISQLPQLFYRKVFFPSTPHYQCY
uniref:Uncharacterized protein n=1 Tax=Anguilla anguilla TaxID=7936 RepID=A0A0E9RG60_ANGAN